jgi:DNA-binding transcriptional ArsR family regulator
MRVRFAHVAAIQTLEAELFRVLSHPVRVRVLELLAEGERSVGELHALLAAADGGSQNMSAASQHLSVLRREGLVESRKAGKSVLYRIKDGRSSELLALARELICTRLEEGQALLGRLVDEAATERDVRP